MQRRLEKRGNGNIVLVIGKEDSRARSVLESLGPDVGYLGWWRDQKDEYTLRVMSPSHSYTPVALKLCRVLANTINVIENYNKWELTSTEFGIEPCLIKIEDEVYATFERLKKRVDEIAKEEEERQARHDALTKRIRDVESMIDNEVIDGKHTRAVLRREIEFGRLEETCANKTLYEMYDDGLI